MNGEQLMLFQPPQQRNRRQRPEEEAVMTAVITLRRTGRQVYAGGRAHQVDGRLLSTDQLLALADAAANP